MGGEFSESIDSPLDSPLLRDRITSNKCFPPPQLFKPKSKNFPTLGNNPNIWAFVQQITKEVEEMTWSRSCPDNFSPPHRKALQSLQKNVDLIIKPADKGGNLVVMDCANYEHVSTYSSKSGMI